MLRARIGLLMRNARTGLILVFLSLSLFLNPKLAFWTTMGIPISFMGAFWLMPLFGVSINMISLFALIMALGIVVDDAIVVGENIFEYRQRGMDGISAAVKGAKEMAMPVVLIAGGKDKGGPLDTARGFTMMMNSVARGIKDVVRNMDEDIISPAIIYLYQMQLLYSNDQEWFDSDLNIVAMGATSLIQQEAAALRRNEFLAIAQSPIVMEIIGIEGFAEVLRGVTDGLDLPSGNIVPTKEAIARKAKMQQLTAQVEQGLTAQPGGTKEVPNNMKEAA